MSEGLVLWGTQKGKKKKPPRKVDGDLSTWQKGINSLEKNDKRESNQKVGLKRWNLEDLEKVRTKVSLLGPLERES